MQVVTNGLEPHNEPNKRHMRMRKTSCSALSQLHIRETL